MSEFISSSTQERAFSLFSKMSDNSEWHKKFCFQWVIKRPDLDRIRYSPLFRVNGGQVFLEYFKTVLSSYHIRLRVMLHPLEGRQSFVFTVHVEGKDGSILPLSSRKDIVLTDNSCIWGPYEESTILKAVPDFMTDGLMKFLVIVDSTPTEEIYQYLADISLMIDTPLHTRKLPSDADFRAHEENLAPDNKLNPQPKDKSRALKEETSHLDGSDVPCWKAADLETSHSNNEKVISTGRDSDQVVSPEENGDLQLGNLSNQSRHVSEAHVEKSFGSQKRKAHTGALLGYVKKHKCSKCEFSTLLVANLRQHVSEVHECSKSHKCNNCDYRASQIGNLRRHVSAVHEGVRPYNCEECNHSAARISDLRKHVRAVHERSKPYKCKECNYRASQFGNLRSHVLRKHALIILK